MTTEGPNYAGSSANYDDGSSTSWTNPSNAAGSNSGTYASIDLLSIFDSGDVLRLTNFGFSIPEDETITGVVVEVRCEAVSDTIGWNNVQLLNGGAEDGSNLSDSTSLGTLQTKTFGSSSNLWGVSLFPMIVNDSSFGVSFKVEKLPSAFPDTGRIYWARITVYYGSGSESSSSTQINYKSSMAVNGPNINLGYTEYDVIANENYGASIQSVSISGFPSGDFSLFVNTDAPSSIYTNDFSLYKYSDHGVNLQFYNNSGSITSASIDISDYNTSNYLQYKGCLLTYRNSIFNYYYLDSDGFRLCYTSPTIVRRNTDNILRIDASRNYQYEQPYSLSRIGIASSGISSEQIGVVEDWLINTLGQLPTNTSGSYSSSDLHAVYSMPSVVSGWAGRLNGMIGDLAYISGLVDLHEIPEDSTLYMEVVVEYTGNNPSGVFLSPSITKNSNGYTNIWTPGDLRILPSSGIHKVTLYDSVTDTGTYPLHPSQFEFRTYSENCASGYRGGDINIYAMNFYIDQAYCLPPTPAYENMLLFISGGQVSTDSVDLFIDGNLTNTSGLDLFLKTTELSSANSGTLFIEGGPFNDNIPLYLDCDPNPTKSGQLNIFLYSTTDSGIFDSMPIYLEAGNYGESIPLYLKSDESGIVSGIVPLYLQGEGNIAGDLSLFLATSSGINSSTNLMISGAGFGDGWNSINGGCTLYLERSGFGVENSIPMYLGVNSGINSEVLMTINGGNWTNNQVDLFVSGTGHENNNVKLIIPGF